VDPVSDLELGFSEELRIGFGREQFGQGLEIGLSSALERLKEFLGVPGLFGSENGRCHESPP
jgi:hypothetical protein